MSHRVRNIAFPRGSEDGPCICTCGWSGRASQFADHRKQVGERRAYANGRAVGPTKLDVSGLARR